MAGKTLSRGGVVMPSLDGLPPEEVLQHLDTTLAHILDRADDPLAVCRGILDRGAEATFKLREIDLPDAERAEVMATLRAVELALPRINETVTRTRVEVQSKLAGLQSKLAGLQSKVESWSPRHDEAETLLVQAQEIAARIQERDARIHEHTKWSGPKSRMASAAQLAGYVRAYARNARSAEFSREGGAPDLAKGAAILRVVIERRERGQSRFVGAHRHNLALLDQAAKKLPVWAFDSLIATKPERVLTLTPEELVISEWPTTPVGVERADLLATAQVALMLFKVLALLALAVGRSYPGAILALLRDFVELCAPQVAAPAPERLEQRPGRPPSALVVAQPRVARAPGRRRPSSMSTRPRRAVRATRGALLA